MFYAHYYITTLLIADVMSLRSGLPSPRRIDGDRSRTNKQHRIWLTLCVQYFESLYNGFQPYFGTDGPVGEVHSALECHAHVLYRNSYRCGYRGTDNRASELVKARYQAPSTMLSPHCGPRRPYPPCRTAPRRLSNAESCVSSRPHVTADVTDAGTGLRGDAT